MKKIMMGFAVLALTLTSCSKNDVFETESASNAIRFTNLNDLLTTKSANDNKDNYGIYAVLNGGMPAASGWFMGNQEVNGINNSYSPLKYWPKEGTVDFYAYAPYNSANISLTEVAWSASNPAFDITYTVPADADEDLTVAEPQKGMSSSEVKLIFSHILSKVDFLANLSDDLKNDGFELELNFVAVKVAYNKGKNSISAPGSWSSLSLSGSDGTYSGANSYMIMPQPAPNTEITLNVTITHNGAEYFDGNLKTYVLQSENLTSFDKMTRYLFTVTVGDTTSDSTDNPVFNVISFSSEIAPWDQSAISIVQN